MLRSSSVWWPVTGRCTGRSTAPRVQSIWRMVMQVDVRAGDARVQRAARDLLDQVPQLRELGPEVIVDVDQMLGRRLLIGGVPCRPIRGGPTRAAALIPRLLRRQSRAVISGRRYGQGDRAGLRRGCAAVDRRLRRASDHHGRPGRGAARSLHQLADTGATSSAKRRTIRSELTERMNVLIPSVSAGSASCLSSRRATPGESRNRVRTRR